MGNLTISCPLHFANCNYFCVSTVEEWHLLVKKWGDALSRAECIFNYIFVLIAFMMLIPFQFCFKVAKGFTLGLAC